MKANDEAISFQCYANYLAEISNEISIIYILKESHKYIAMFIGPNRNYLGSNNYSYRFTKATNTIDKFSIMHMGCNCNNMCIDVRQWSIHQCINASMHQ